MKRTLRKVVVAHMLALITFNGLAQTPRPGQVILAELRKGGLVLYFRHMHADVGEDQIGDATFWKECAKQRNLSPHGKSAAHKVGLLIRGLAVPVSKVRSGELCRAKQSAEALALGAVETTPSLNDYNTWKAQGRDPEQLLAAYRSELITASTPSTNVVLVSHAHRGRFTAHPVLDLIEMGTAAVFRPHADGSYELLGTVRPSDWELLGDTELPSK